jgi:hypothetical protein
MKTATCTHTVPAVLSPTGAKIEKGATLNYTCVLFRNGEHHLVLMSGKWVPSIFFDFQEAHT